MAESNEPRATDYYALLGLPNHATPASIEQALAKEETRLDDARSGSDSGKAEAYDLLLRKVSLIGIYEVLWSTYKRIDYS